MLFASVNIQASNGGEASKTEKAVAAVAVSAPAITILSQATNCETPNGSFSASTTVSGYAGVNYLVQFRNATLTTTWSTLAGGPFTGAGPTVHNLPNQTGLTPGTYAFQVRLIDPVSGIVYEGPVGSNAVITGASTTPVFNGPTSIGICPAGLGGSAAGTPATLANLVQTVAICPGSPNAAPNALGFTAGLRFTPANVPAATGDIVVDRWDDRNNNNVIDAGELASKTIRVNIVNNAPVFTAFPIAAGTIAGAGIWAGTNGACGSSFSAVTPVACGATVGFPTPAATDDCAAPLAFTVSINGAAPVAAGATVPLGPGSYTLVFTANDGANATSCTYNVTVAQAFGSLVCVGNYNVTLTNCTQTISFDLLIANINALNNYLACNPGAVLVVDIFRNGRWVNGTPAVPHATITAADAGVQGLQYRIRDVTNGTSCWGNLLVEDKVAPVITCPANVILACQDANFVNELSVTGDFLPGGGNNGTVLECSFPIEQRYTDVREDWPCGTGAPAITAVPGFTIPAGSVLIARITRTWTVKDKFGNISAPCVQIIQVIRTPVLFGTVDIEDRTESCAGISKAEVAGVNYNARPFIDNGAGGGTAGDGVRNGTEPFITLDPNVAGTCGLFTRLVRVDSLVICGGGVKYTKFWDVIDMCQPGGMVIGTLVQLINWQDITRPTSGISVDQHTLVAGTPYCFTMQGMPTMNNLPTVTREFSRIAQFFGDSLDNNGNPVLDGNGINVKAITVNALADQVTCLMGMVRFSLSGLDATNCSGFTGAPTVSVSDSRIAASGSNFTGSFMFAAHDEIQTFTVTITDACGNRRTQTIRVRYVDNANPNAICKAATITIPAGSRTARLNVNSINNSSTDNCGIKNIMMRKMTSATAPAQTGTTNCYADVLDYDCSEVGSNNMVALRIVDFNDNVTECMVNVTVDIKPTVSCVSQPTVTRICTSNDLLDFRALYVDPATTITSSHPDCITTTAEILTDPTLGALTCTQRTITRTWRARAVVNGVTYTSATCSQSITVTPVRGFRVTRLANERLTCVGVAANIGSPEFKVSERNRVIAGLDLTNCSGVKTCAAPVVSVDIDSFASNQYCKIYRLRYKIVDECVGPAIAFIPAQGEYGRLVGNCTSTDPTGQIIQDRDDAVVFERFIYVDDRTAPTSTITVRSVDICDQNSPDTDSRECVFGFTRTLTGTDGCANFGTSEPGTLYYMWRVLNADTRAQIGADGTGATVSRTGLTFGTYVILFRITDLCGNMSVEDSIRITGRDCKAPEIRIHDKVVALAGQPGVPSTGMGFVTYADISNFIQDNCDATLTTTTSKIYMQRTTVALPAVAASAPVGFTGSNWNGTTGIMFTCADIPAGANRATVGVRVWTVDASGNWNYAVSTVTVQDNDRICSGVVGQIAGAVANEAGINVDNVTVAARANGASIGSAVTAANGAFSINVPVGSNVQVTAAKTVDTDAREGVSTADIAAISRHILGSQALNSAYSIIAADVDKNGSVEAADMLQIRRFVLHISPALPAGNFRFVDKAYTFRDASAPLGEDFPEVVNASNVQAAVAANFVAVKLGDVNNSYRHVSVRGSRALTLTATDMDVIAGNEYTVNVNAANFDAAAFQGTFSFNGVSVKSIKAGSLAGMSDANFGMVNNAVTTSWNGKATGTAEVVAITFVANKSGKLSEMMSFGSALTAAEAIAANGEVLNATLKFNTGKTSGQEFALYQNTPNPVATTTKVGFNLPKDGEARFTVFNAEGKVIFARNNEFKAGYNEIILNKSELAAGVLYYRLETADHSATKKMIIIE
jgi:hypothetical protein